MATTSSAAATLQWHAQTAGGKTSAVALVLPGLNVNPQCMLPLVSALNGWGIEALNCALMGHGGNFPAHPGLDEQATRLAAFGRVTYPLWRDEITAAYHIAAGRAAQCGVPVILVGFSLGGLLGCAAALSSPQVRFARIVLLAPALRIHRRSKVLMALARWPQLVIPSATPAAYRANRGTTMAAYNALYAAQRQCERLLAQPPLAERLNVPTLVLVDPQDEMVSAAGLEQLAAERRLARWQFYEVHKGAGAQTRYHHLLIDSPSVGPRVWAVMLARLHEHLTSSL